MAATLSPETTQAIDDAIRAHERWTHHVDRCWPCLTREACPAEDGLWHAYLPLRRRAEGR